MNIEDQDKKVYALRDSLLRGLKADPLTFVWSSRFADTADLLARQDWAEARRRIEAIGYAELLDMYNHMRNSCVYVPEVQDAWKWTA